ncbi:Mitochondrial import inner membrane translocase subunit TIM10, partial [Dichanthelium oligosanthes]
LRKAGQPTWRRSRYMFGMAEKEMEYRVDLFNRLTQTCFDKCVEKRYKEAELNMGENSCIDRCVSKYWQASLLILFLFADSFVYLFNCLKFLQLDFIIA